MTVNYAANLDRTNRFSSIFFRWEGSIYKLIWIELVIFTIISVFFGVLRVFLMSDRQQIKFDIFCEYCLYLSSRIPVAFILPFFVRLIIDRRFNQFKSIPWIDQMAIYLNTFIIGSTDIVIMTKRTILRYLILSMTLCFQTISSPVERRFHNYDIYISTGLATEEEIESFSKIEFKYNLYFVPIVWAGEILRKADRVGVVVGERCVALLMNEICRFNEKLQSIFFYDWINVPLVYTHVSTVCVYIFFITAIFGGQVIGKNMYKELIGENQIDNSTINTTSNMAQEYVSIVPFFGLIQFGIYVGWLKVAETMINPYGDDDEDFEIVAIIERNLQIGFQIVDKVKMFSPAVIENVIPIYLRAGYTESKSACNLFMGSQWAIEENEEEQGRQSVAAHELEMIVSVEEEKEEGGDKKKEDEDEDESHKNTRSQTTSPTETKTRNSTKSVTLSPTLKRENTVSFASDENSFGHGVKYLSYTVLDDDDDN